MKVVATYQIPAKECPDPEKRGKAIAVGMTIGSWSGLSPVQREKQFRYAGEFAGYEPFDLPVGAVVRIKVAYPVSNFPPRLSEILVAVFGKLSMDGEIKLVDLSFPPDYSSLFPGPRIGLDGIRNQLNLFHRPLLMSIFKCGFGLTPKEYAAAFAEQVEGGVDLVKDDEIFFDETDRLDRVKYCREVIDRFIHRENRRVLYAVNLSAPASRLLETAHRLVQAGAGALLINVIAYGLTALQELAQDPDLNVILMAHPALAGALYSAPFHGFSSPLLLGSLMRMAGADLSLFPSPYGNVCLPIEEALQIGKRLREPGSHRAAFPVPSAGIQPGLVPRILSDFGRDVVVNAGGGIHHHPGGTQTGARAFRDAIEGVCEGKDLEAIAVTSAPLRDALARWT